MLIQFELIISNIIHDLGSDALSKKIDFAEDGKIDLKVTSLYGHKVCFSPGDHGRDDYTGLLLLLISRRYSLRTAALVAFTLSSPALTWLSMELEDGTLAKIL